MSGGVDSSVAACLLKEHGYDCIGVFMRVGAQAEEEACAVSARPAAVVDPGDGAAAKPGPDAPAPRRLRHGCCSASDALDARAVAGKLGIPFYALNFRDDFDRIINYFVDEYARARTPNPCVMCNIQLKFGKLLEYATMLDAQYVATGHYARLRRDAPPAGGVRLARAVNLAKDQSYVLFGIPRAALARCLFPLGEMADKADVRRLAAALGLRVHDKPDSQEICFVPNNDYRALVAARRPEALRPGEIRDTNGAALGTHDGLGNFTIGQRRGLGLATSGPSAATGVPLYVIGLDVATNTVRVGREEELGCDGLVACGVNWLMDPAPVGGAARACRVKIRHMHAPAAGRLRVLANGDVEGRFDEPQSAVTPGQAAVFYDEDDAVICGGWIDRALRDAAEE